MKMLVTSLRIFVWLSILTGILYPLFVTLIATLSMHQKAHGSFVVVNNKTIGSQLIAQEFKSDLYFWPRPSACNYNPLPSGASNLGPISAELKKQVDLRLKQISKAHGGVKRNKIPSELVFASGSGLDPHITIPCAYFQMERIVKARNLPNSFKVKLKKLVDSMAEGWYLSRHSNMYVNVLFLNIELDKLVGQNG